MKLQRYFFLTAVICLLNSTLYAQTGRTEIVLSGDGWRMWRDQAALWYNDKIFLPPVDISKLPVKPPTCGWDNLAKHYDKIVTVPGTVEEHYWGEIGGAVPDTAGDYIGVSWWSRTFTLDPSLKGKRLVIHFESANLRSEVFINNKLAGYDVIGNTPFIVNITDLVRFGSENRLDVRITDPVGNFSWNDNILMRWGENLIPAVHGFGGITGPVTLIATDNVVVEDVYVQNQPDPHTVKVFVTVSNYSGTPQKGNVALSLDDFWNEGQSVWNKSVAVTIPAGEQVVSFKATVQKAKLWELSGHRNLKKANLYNAKAVFTGSDNKITDSKSQRFGFRYFYIDEKDGDQRFYLNGKRVFVMAAMTRGFWPKNGMFATPEMAQRELEILVDLGYNMMLLHRAIGQPPVLDYADKYGLMTYEEPGGYMVTPNKEDNIDGPDEQALDLRREKLRRMIIRDRSYPSMVIYNLKNESQIKPTEDDYNNMKMVFKLDPSRILTYNSDRNREINYFERIENDPYKVHMRPFDDKLRYDWWDHHHWMSYPGYVDLMYRNPQFYLRGVVNAPTTPSLADSLYRLDKRELIFWGEEGNWGTMVRLQKIVEELEKTGGPTGFREMEHVDWFNTYNKFLDESGFRASFPDVDALTMSMGRNLHYYHARIIENVRLSNIADGYNLNGWASEINRTDIADMYRYPTADPAIMQYYTQPLYVAVKLRNKVVPVGATPIVDFYIINENNLNGNCLLSIDLTNEDGKIYLTKEVKVNIKGSEEFGQLLYEGLELPVIDKPGYFKVNATITKNGVKSATGFDDIFAVDYTIGHNTPSKITIFENDGVVIDFLKKARGITATSYQIGGDQPDVIIVGNFDPDKSNPEIRNDIFGKVIKGAKLIVLHRADYFAAGINELQKRRPAFYKTGGIRALGTNGRYFVSKSPYFEGLPQAQALQWEYQCLYSDFFVFNRNIIAGLPLDIKGSEWHVALGDCKTSGIYCALNKVQVGTGNVILSTLNILQNLASNQPNSAVAKKLFMNMIEY
jgi:beta-galactosidase